MTKCTRCGGNNPAEIHTCTPQSKAQRLADEFDNGELIAHTNQWKEEATSELLRLDQSEREGWRYADELEQERKRLTALNAELVERLQQMCDETEEGFISTITRAECRLLIAKAKEQT